MNTLIKFYMWILIAIAGAFLINLLGFYPSRAAGPWYVTTGGNDNNNCLTPGMACKTINGALNKASSGDMIYVAVGNYTNSSGDEVVLVDKDITLSGGWNPSFTVQNGKSVINGESIRRGMTVNNGVIQAFVENFQIQNGSNLDGASGGGIFNSGVITLTNTVFLGNATGCLGSAVYNEGTFILNNGVISQNTGGGIYCLSSAVMNDGSGVMTLTNTTVNDNLPDGGLYNYGTMTIVGSTISNNIGGESAPGGIFNWGGSLTLINSTVSGNVTSSGGGIFNGGGGNVVLRNTTISDNIATELAGGGIFNQVGSTVVLYNTIIAGNVASTSSQDCLGVLTSQGFNLIQDTSGCTITGDTTSNLIGLDALLGPLQANGGSTYTHALLFGSPAIDGGSPITPGSGGNACETHDQRGVVRPQFTSCDIGAFELEGSVQFANSNFTIDEKMGTATVTVTLSVPLTQTVTVAYSTSDGTASAETDYLAATGTLTFTPGVVAQTFNIIVVDDMVGESSETMVVTLDNAINAVLGVPSLMTMTIVDNDFIYLPLVGRSSSGIYGYVTLNGIPIADVLLELHLIYPDTIVATTTTGPDGRYAFRNMPGLASGQSYYVLYQNIQGTPGRLENWETGRITTYTAGGEAAIGDFDIADVVLVSPGGGALVSIPATFQWIPRPASPTDNYEFDLFDPDDFEPYFTAPFLGYVGGYTLDFLPEGFDPNTDYVWAIVIFSPDGGIGISNNRFVVSFSNPNVFVSPLEPTILPNNPPDLEIPLNK